MNRSVLHKLLALLCGLLLIGATLLTGCAAKPAETPETSHGEEGEKHEKDALVYRTNRGEDGTYGFQIVKEEEVLFSKSGMDRAGIKEVHSADVFSVSWITGNNPTDYETIYCNNKTGVVSDVIAGVLATDGVRIVYTKTDDTGCYVIVRDIFDKSISFPQALVGAYTGGEYTVIGAIATDKTHVNVSYLCDSKGTYQLVNVNMYPEGKATSTKKPEADKK